MSAAPLTPAGRLRAIFSGSIGNLVEYYDWYAYSAFALYFSKAFFPGSNPTAQLLNTAGVFALGFFRNRIGPGTGFAEHVAQVNVFAAFDQGLGQIAFGMKAKVPAPHGCEDRTITRHRRIKNSHGHHRLAVQGGQRISHRSTPVVGHHMEAPFVQHLGHQAPDVLCHRACVVTGRGP